MSPGGFLVTAALIAFSFRFLDAGIALWFGDLLRSDPHLWRYASRIPDLLLPAVLVLSGVLWAMYLRRVRRGIRDETARFCLLSGAAMPAAFAAKAVLKPLFGRMNTRAWLAKGGDLSFHWFHGGGEYGSFPSGHMAVFTALAAACWLFYPKYRAASLAAITALGVALVATDYHYLSDVIAGGYLGLAVLAGTGRCLGRLATGRPLPGDRGRGSPPPGGR
ncbi:phosphatase PAP2 family protein [bacterium]|nr:phosphatase PAP2 family protein [bacterium]